MLPVARHGGASDNGLRGRDAAKGLNFILTTTAGEFDLLGEITYGGTCGAMLSDTEVVTVLGIECRCLSLEQLIQVKRSAGRVKDLQASTSWKPSLRNVAAERRSRSRWHPSR